MELYLMRHGDAKSEEQDPARPLTEAGRAAVERVAGRAAAAGVRLDGVQHSGILRARQTAEILARQAAADGAAQPREGLRPLDPVEPVARELLEQAAGARAVALVGHLPFLERLVSRLVAGDEEAQLLAFGAAALVKLVPQQQRAGFAVRWLLDPEVA